MSGVEQVLPYWRPIETAPFNEQVLVSRRDGVMHVARVGGLKDKRWGVLDADFGNASCQFFFPLENDYEADDAPEFWMPLPVAPEAVLGRAESNASGMPDWEVVSSRVNAARTAIELAKTGGAA